MGGGADEGSAFDGSRFDGSMVPVLRFCGSRVSGFHVLAFDIGM
jgi:hypothetical protein